MTRPARHVRVCRECKTKVRDCSKETFACTGCGGTTSKFWARQSPDPVPVIDPEREAVRKHELQRSNYVLQKTGNWHDPTKRLINTNKRRGDWGLGYRPASDD